MPLRCLLLRLSSFWALGVLAGCVVGGRKLSCEVCLVGSGGGGAWICAVCIQTVEPSHAAATLGKTPPRRRSFPRALSQRHKENIRPFLHYSYVIRDLSVPALILSFFSLWFFFQSCTRCNRSASLNTSLSRRPRASPYSLGASWEGTWKETYKPPLLP